MTEKERVVKVGTRGIDLAKRRPVFRIVDGKLVRIPGDARNPSKRYRAVSAADGTYDVEFTEAEERQRDEEEAAWKAAAPQREAERRRQAEEAGKLRASLRYEPRITAFLDVLGWSDAIKRSATDSKLAQDLGMALNASMGAARLVEWMGKHGGSEGWPGDPQITHFSDSVLLSVQANQMAEETLTFHLSGILHALLRLGYLVRGGIAEGALIHKGAIAYGPALVAAYDLERHSSIYPRVVLDESLAKQWGAGKRIVDMTGRTIGRVRYWRRDLDGRYFYDFLNPLPGMHAPPNARLLEAHLSSVRTLIDEQLKEHGTERTIRDKYVWTARYFNTFCDEHDLSTVDRLDTI